MIVIANPAAGRGRAGRAIARVDRLLDRAGVVHEVRVSESGPDLERLAREAAGQGARVVAALGGDGTMGLAANGLLGTAAALAPLPSGTADDFARALGIESIEGAVRAIVDGNVVPIDVVRVTTETQQRHYVNVAGCGFDSEVSEAANAMRVTLGGAGTYLAALLKTLSRFTPAAFQIELDDEVVEGPHMLVVVGNSTTYGGGMMVTPGASVVDGVLDVCLLEAMSMPAFLWAFPRVFRGTHVRHPRVRMARARRVAITADRRVTVYADGERVGPAPAVFEVVPEALRVVIGPNATAVR
ncbi:MAG: diacylglycerol kinase family lipid kinase [Acidobacteria bacterium]|nr:diacylglycerol kinase family lipid kinase [Acidobacteriota bacterium]